MTEKRAFEMAQQVNAFATKIDDVNLIPKTYMVEGENQFLQVNLHLWVMAHTCHLPPNK